MLNAIIIDHNPFDFKSKASIYKNGIQEQIDVFSDIDNLSQAILGIAYNNDLFEVKTNASANFISELSKAISKYEFAQYSNNKIKIEGF